MKNRRAYFNIDYSSYYDNVDAASSSRSLTSFIIVSAVGLMFSAFAISMFVMDIRHGGVSCWSVVRLVTAFFLIAIAIEDALTKEIHDVLLLGLALVGIGSLLLSLIGHNTFELSCFDFFPGIDLFTEAHSLGSSTASCCFASNILQFGFSEPGWCLVGGAGRIAGCLCVSLPMLAVTLIWSGSFGIGDVLMCIGAGLILGPAFIFYGVAIAMILAGALSAVLLLFGILKRTDSIPFGPFLSIGFLLMLYCNTI